MSIAEQIAHDLIQEYNVGCTAKDCDNRYIELSHDIPQTKVNAKILGVALDILGLNVMPLCKQHHADKHAGKFIIHEDKKLGRLYLLGSEQLHRYLARVHK